MKTITINNKEFKWKFSFKAITELEKLEGKTSNEIAKVLDSISDEGIPFDLIVNIAFCGLKQLNEITKDEIINLLDDSTAESIIEILNIYGESVKGYMSIPNSKGQA